MSPTSYLTAPPRGDPWWTCDCTGARRHRQPAAERPRAARAAAATVGSDAVPPAVSTCGPAWPPCRRCARSGRSVALAIHSQQLDERLTRMEHRLEELATDERDLDVPTHDDLLEVRLHSARVSAELTQVAVELQARIDDLAVQHARRRRRRSPTAPGSHPRRDDHRPERLARHHADRPRRRARRVGRHRLISPT